MTEVASTAEVEANSSPQSAELSMRADADVRWANPDALTREQMIRASALNAALSYRGSTFGERCTVEQLLEDAEQIAAWITDGEVSS